MDERADLIAGLAHRLTENRMGHPLRVGVDGVVGAGKSTFARDLVAALITSGTPAVHLDSDGFHHPREVRHRRGRDSARGYYADAYDFGALADQVLRPLGPGGNGVYAVTVHDLGTDETITDATARAEPDSIVVFDCTFLQRGPLRALWDVVIWLDVDAEVAVQRGVLRDAASLGGVARATAAYRSRYMAACEIYLAEEDPIGRASIVIDHTDPLAPSLVRAG